MLRRTADNTDAQSWYLLGRCYMSQQKYSKAYEAYQQAVYRDGRNPTFWCSIGVLYYQINQYRDALDAYSRAIRLNPYISEVWYDLGTLVRLPVMRSITCTQRLMATFSMSLATIKLPMRLMPISVQQTLTPVISTSRRVCNSCVMANLLACPLPKMFTLSNIKLLVSALHQARNGVFPGPRRCPKDLHQPRPGHLTTGIGA